MTAENQFAKEVVEIGEKSGLDLNSHQDLPKPNCNGSSQCDQVNGLENSYILVTEDNGLSDDHAVKKEDLVAAKGSSGLGDDHEVEKEDLGAVKGFVVESKVPVDVQIERLDLLDEEVIKSIKEGEDELVESSIVDLTVVEGNDTPLEVEKLPEDGDGTPAVADAPEEQSEETESHLVALIKSVEVPVARVESLVEAETEAAADLHENNIVETEIKPPILDGEAVIAAVEIEDQSEKVEIDLVAEIKSFEVPNGKIESLVESDRDAVVDHIVDSENVVETEIKPLQDAEDLVTVDLPTIEDPKSLSKEGECVVAEIKLFEVPNGRLEGLVNAETESNGEQNGNPENVVELVTKTLVQDAQVVVTVAPEEQKEEPESDVAEMKLVESPSGTLQSLSEVETVTVEEQNGNSENLMEIEIKPSIQVAEFVVTVPPYEQSEETTSDVVAEIDSVEVQNGRPESLVEVETEQSEETQSDLMAEIKSVEVPNGKPETLVEVEKETVATEEQHEEYGSGVVDEIDSVEVQNGRPERMMEVETETAATEEQSEETQSELVAEIKSVEVPNGRPETLVEVEKNTVLTEEQSEETENDVVAEIDSVEVQNGRPECLVEVGTETVATGEQSEETRSDMVAEIKSIEIPNGRPKTLVEVEKAAVATEEQSEETESDVVAEIDSVEVLNGRPESLVEIETEEQSEETQSDLLAEIKSVEVPNRTPETLVEVEKETVATAERSKEITSDIVAEIESVDRSLGSLIEVKTETVVEQNGNSENVAETEIKSPIQNAEAVLTVGSPPSEDHQESQAFESGNPGLQASQPNYSKCDPSSVPEFVPHVDDFEKKEPHSECSEAHVENEVVNVALEAPVHGSSASITEVLKTDVTGTCGDETLEGFDVNIKDPSNSVLQNEDTKDLQDQLDTPTIGSTDETSCLQENTNTEKSESDTISTPPPEDLSTDVILGGDTTIVAETQPLYTCVFKVPRFGDENLRERIRLAKEKVDETTKARDAIQVQIQEKRTTIQTHGNNYESTKRDDRDARRLVKLKRIDIDSIQSVISKAKNATSIGDIDKQLYCIEHRIQHETLPLKEEKLLIREIKTLKQHRAQLSANLRTTDEINEALERGEDAEKELKIRKAELDVLKNEVLKAEAIALEAERKYDHAIKEVKELQGAYKVADDVRQEAFVQWLSLKKELTEKNKWFFKYKDDAAAAYNYGQQREMDSVNRVCTDQIEKMMELWNTNVEFRKEYINSNTRSTVLRFGNLDGRGLGSGEKPHILPSNVNERFQRRNTLPTPSPKVVDSVSQTPPEPNAETSIDSDDKPLKSDENKNQTAKTVKTKGAAKPVPSENGLATVSGRDAEVEVVVVQEEEEPVKSKEEIELERKAEETRKSEAEAALRKQRIENERIRAEEARERKKRQAEKLQARALMKAQKEAEQKEKEREKRMRKKERKKTKGTNVNDDHLSESVEVTVENGGEETVDVAKEIILPTPVVKNKKQSQKAKQQIKSKSTIPPPLRNRNKKKWQQYMYVAAACLLVLVLFLLGNRGFFSAKTINYSESSA